MRTLMLAAILGAGAAGAASAQTVVQISEQDCSQLIRHVAANDTQFTPGIDVAGNPVAPADLDGAAPIRLPATIAFPLTLDLARRLGIPASGNADYLARPVIGEISVTNDGRVAFNGVPLTSEAQHELALRCQRTGKTP